MDGGEKIFPVVDDGYSSSSSSRIGKDSDGENEVESPYKGPLDSMDSLQEALPIRRGLSEFYTGKSKSFRNLADAASISIKDLGKPENPQNSRKRIFFGYGICNRGGISKKPIKSAFTAIRVTVTKEEEQDHSSSSSGEYSPPRKHQVIKPLLPPRQSKGSFANCVPVVDLPRCYETAANGNVHNIIC